MSFVGQNHRNIGYASLNEAAIWWKLKNHIRPELAPFTDPDTTNRMVRDLHAHLGLGASYGGWQENRRELWRGTYLEKDGLWIHTGIDLNIRVGADVYALATGPIVYIGDDRLPGGWGGHVIQKIRFRGEIHALIYAHLEVNQNLHIDRMADTTTCVGLVGTKERNGYWYPHVHVQLFAKVDDVVDWAAFSKEMDGYVMPAHAAMWARKCPDPTPLIFCAT